MQVKKQQLEPDLHYLSEFSQAMDVMTMTRPARWNLYTLAENYPEYMDRYSITMESRGIRAKKLFSGKCLEQAG